MLNALIFISKFKNGWSDNCGLSLNNNLSIKESFLVGNPIKGREWEKMKKMLLTAVLAVGLLSVGCISWAIPIYGEEDLLKGSGNIGPSNPSNEAAFVNGILGTSFGAADLVQRTGVSRTLVDPSHGAFILPSDPEWFIVKAGNIHYLYENKDALGWGYVDLADAGMSSNPQGVYTANGISHYSELGGNAPCIPERVAWGIG